MREVRHCKNVAAGHASHPSGAKGGRNRQPAAARNAWLGSYCVSIFSQSYAAPPSWARTAPPSPETGPNAPTPKTTNRSAQPAALTAPPSQVPVITPLTNPAVISPQAQLDYNLQIPLFRDLPFHKELREQGIDFIAHYISQTASNTAGIHGTGTAYAGQVDFGLSFDLDKLGIWSDVIARYAMTERARVNL